MTLKEYHRKRHFNLTPEPRGKPAKKGWLYVIQKHAASHLHYDFRLQLGGVLLSWAVPKGPSLNPKVKRLAMHVEDHPVDYGDFEGIIPEGEYGGGTVMLWDQGYWEPDGDPAEGYRQGKLKFKLVGQKLHGGWVLYRAHGKQPGDRDGRQWFLFKLKDEAARESGKIEITEESPLSVATGRDLDGIASDRDRVWGSKNSKHPGEQTVKKRLAKSAAAKTMPAKAAVKKKKPPAKKAPAKKSARGKRKPVDPSEIPGACQGKLPRKIVPQLATLTKQAPADDQWLHEIKFDGYRMICRIDGEEISFTSRNQQSWTTRLEHLVEQAKSLPVKQVILDGEVVALETNGATNFQGLQNAFSEGRGQDLLYYAFDILYLDGYDLTRSPLRSRKQVLADLIRKDLGHIRYSEHIIGHGPDFFAQACKLKLEGIISKRADRPYSEGRGYDWLKVKCSQRDEFVIGGYTDPSGARSGFGALLVGYHNGEDKLVYAGKVGTGFNERTLHDLLAEMKSLEQKTSPFSNLSGRTGVARHAHWIKPKLVAQVEFGEWTRDGRLRHPTFQGLRADKPASKVVRDTPVPVEMAVKKSGGADSHTSNNGAGNHKQSESAVAKSKTSSQAGANGSAQTKARPSSRLSSRLSDRSAALVEDQLAGFRLTSPDKVLYPEQGVTKLDLARYYASIADWVMPHVQGRPLVLVRCPEGREKACFYQKHAGIGSPANLRQIPVREKNKTAKYVVVDDLAGLVSLVQIGVLEIHAWGARADKIEAPDRLIFDLDPDPSVDWKKVVESARQIREFLDNLGLRTFVKTTGGKGLHIVAPVDRRGDWDDVRAFCQGVAETIVKADPARYTSNMSKAARVGKIYIDYLRNARGATAVAAYSTRSRPGATVSTPVDWDELDELSGPDQFNILNLPQRLSHLKQDPWRELATTRQALSASMKRQLKIS